MATLVGNQYAPDDYGEASQQAQDQYVTPASDYMSAAAGDTFVGSGSLVRLQQQRYIDSMGGDPIKADEWNPANPLYDKRIRYYDGLTTDKVKAITQLNDEDADRAIAREHASTAMGVASLPARLIMGLFEPLQAVELAGTVAAGAATGGLADAPIIGARVAAIAEALDSSSPAVRIAAKSLAEGAAFTAAGAPAQIYGARTMGQDINSVDFLKEFGMNALMIGALHTAFHGFGASAEKVAVDPNTFDNINDQVKAGVAPDVNGATSTSVAAQKADVQGRLDVLQRQKDSRMDYEGSQRDQIESLQTQKLAIANGIEGTDPARVPAIVDAITAVKEGGPGAENAKAFLDQNGVEMPKETAPEPLPALPKELSKSAPRFGKSKIGFESDVDRALYVVREESAGTSAAHDKFMDFLENKVGLSADEIAEGSRAVTAAIKDAGKAAKGEDFQLKQVYEKPTDNMSPASRSKIADIDSKIEQLKSTLTGPDSLEKLRQKIKMHQDELASFPTDEELTKRAGTEMTRRLDPGAQSTYRQADLDYASRGAGETNADHAAREIIEDGMKHEDTAEAIAAVDAEYETKLKALDVAISCLGR